MNIDIFSAIIFYALLFFLYAKYKKRFIVQGKVFVLYKTKIGLKLMNKLSKICPKLLRFFGDVGIIAGFIGMVTMFYFLLRGTYNLVFVPSAMPVVSPVLPGVAIPGLPTLSFWHWILSIFIVAVVHEFSHGVYARLSKIKIKSSGFGFFGPILAAFVEPDEKVLSKKSKRDQLRVFSAGPFGNIVLFVVVFLISVFLVTPFVTSKMEYVGVNIVAVEPDSPAAHTNISAGEVITGINSKKIYNLTDFLNVARGLRPHENVVIETEGGSYSFNTSEHPGNLSRGYMGISVTAKSIGFDSDAVSKYGNGFLNFILWFSKLLFWVYIISFGVGLFNLLPLGPLDGGRMAYTALLFFVKDKRKTKRIFAIITLVCVALIVVNLLPYLLKFLVFLEHLFL